MKGFSVRSPAACACLASAFALCAVTPGCTHEKSPDNNLAIMLLLGAMGSRSSSSSRVFPQALERWQCKTSGTTGDYRVIPIYLAASDNTQQEIEEYVWQLKIAMAAVRSFYSNSLGPAYGNKTFDCTDVKVLTTHHTKAEWLHAGLNGYTRKDNSVTTASCSMWYGAQDELGAWGLLANAGLPALGSAGIGYHAIIGGATNGSCGANHYLSANESKVLDWQAQTCPNGRFDSAATKCDGPGVIAHEMGHMFSLPHCDSRGTCTPSIYASIMYNWPDFDHGAAFSNEDKTDLNVDPFMRAPP